MKTKIFVYILCIFSLIGIFYVLFHNAEIEPREKVTKTIKPSLKPIVQATPSVSYIPDKGLADAINTALEGTTGTYGIVIVNLKTGNSFSMNEHNQFSAGSLYKLWVMGATYNQIQNGFLKEDDVLSQDISYLNGEFDIDPAYAEQTDGILTQSVSDSLNQMITISDNYSALLLSDRITLSSVYDFLSNNGFSESSLGEPPLTTAYDVSLFLEKLYKGQLANEANTQKMMELLKGQNLNDKLPKYLPSEIMVAHKTGDIDTFSHDAGIVFSDRGDYVIVVLSSSDSTVLANERIAEVSKAVYNYFNFN